MAIAFVAQTIGAVYSATGSQTTSHAGGASARGAVVLIHQNASAADQVSGVTYGGKAMTRLHFATEATEAGAVYIYWVDNVAVGTQNVVMTTTGTANKLLVVATMSGTGIAVAGSNTGTSASVANPSWTISGLTAGTKLEAFLVIHSGLQTMTTTPTSPWVNITAVDLGSQGRGFAKQSVASSGTTLTAGWTAATADDYVGAAVAFKEVPAPPGQGSTTGSTVRTGSSTGKKPSGGSVPGLGTNLLTTEQANGSEGGALPEWTTHTSGTTISSSTDFAKSGSRSVKFVQPNTGRASYSTFPSTTNITPGKAYTAVAHILAGAANNPIDNTEFMVALYWFTSADAAIIENYGSLLTINSSEWSRGIVTAVAPPTAARVRILIYSNPIRTDAAVYYVDDCLIAEGHEGTLFAGSAIGEAPVVLTPQGSASGTTVYSGSATGSKPTKGSASGSTVSTGSATGTKAPKGSASGSTVYSGSATGVAPIAMAYGSASGATSVVGSATGKKTPKGSASGTTTETGTATGKKFPKGSAAGSTVSTGLASGTRVSRGSATGSTVYSGSASGDTPANHGSATGTTVFAGSATGKTTPKGSASGTTTSAGSATGKKFPKGSATGSTTESGSATGARTSRGSASGTTTWSGTAQSGDTKAGSASGTTIYSGSATGARPSRGSATGNTPHVGSATGKKSPKGSATGSTVYSGSATGKKAPKGSASGSTIQNGSASGKKVTKGTASGSTVHTSSASGAKPTRGSATGSTIHSGIASGARQSSGHSTGLTTWAALASGIANTFGSASGLTEYLGTAVGNNDSLAQHNAIVTAYLLPRRWTGDLLPSRWDGTLLPSRWDGEILPRRWDGDIQTQRRWEGQLL